MRLHIFLVITDESYLYLSSFIFLSSFKLLRIGQVDERSYPVCVYHVLCQRKRNLKTDATERKKEKVKKKEKL